MDPMRPVGVQHRRDIVRPVLVSVQNGVLLPSESGREDILGVEHDHYIHEQQCFSGKQASFIVSTICIISHHIHQLSSITVHTYMNVIIHVYTTYTST